MRKKRNILERLCIAVGICVFALGTFPVSTCDVGAAEYEDAEYEDELLDTEDEFSGFKLTVGDKTLSPSLTSAYGCTYDPGAHTLTLNSANISSGSNNMYGYETGIGYQDYGSKGALKIILNGDSVITNVSDGMLNIWSCGSLIFDGTGSLTLNHTGINDTFSAGHLEINNGTYIINCENGHGINVFDQEQSSDNGGRPETDGNLNISGGKISCACGYRCITSGGNITISGGEISCKTAKNNNNAIEAQSFSMSGGSVYAESDSANGIRISPGKIVMSGNTATIHSVTKANSNKKALWAVGGFEIGSAYTITNPAGAGISSNSEFIAETPGGTTPAKDVTIKVKSASPETPSSPGTSADPAAAPDSDAVKAFVKRMYTVALDREAEEAGLNDWSGQLTSLKADGATLARGFICSDEFKGKNYGNGDFLNKMYGTFFDREPDEGGFNSWMAELNAGTPREKVLAGFVNSKEFGALCDKYGIARGTMEDDGSNIYNAGVRNFVLRNYTQTLGRNGETEGIEYWAHRINTGELTMKEVAINFLHSEEFLNKGLNNVEYVKVLYRTFLGREADEAGLADWTGQLDRGEKTRDEIVAGFSGSQEFAAIMAQYQ